MRLSIIVPVFNEIDTISEILTRVRSQVYENVEFEIVVVDDGSTDGTREFLEKEANLADQLILNPMNLGKGNAVRKGLEVATGEYVLFQDADTEYDPEDYPKLLKVVTRFDVDLVIGSRFLGAEWTRVAYFWHKVGNVVLTTLFNVLYNTTWTDIYSCYILFRRNLIRPEDLVTDGWEQQAEILTKVCLKSRKLYEVPINYSGRRYDEGKKIRWYHTFKILLAIVRFRVTL